MKHVFVSYAHNDAKEFVDWLMGRLSENGFEVWVDRTRLMAGRDWEQSIEQAIDECACLLAVLTPGSMNSPVCRAEIGYALGAGKRVVPLMRQLVTPPLRLTNLQYLLFTDDSRKMESFDLLLRLLKDQPILEIAQTLPHDPAISPQSGMTVSVRDVQGSLYVAGGDINIMRTETLGFSVNERPNTARDLPEKTYVDRPTEISRLRELLIADDIDKKVALTALHGMGGVGKTMLAEALCHDPIVTEAFPDGVLWIKIGREPSSGDLARRVMDQGIALGDDLSHYATFESGINRLRNVLAERAVLIVLDDVWDTKHVEPFYFNSPKSRTLFTTRNETIALLLGAKELQLNVMETQEAVKLLGMWAGRNDPMLSQVAGRLGNHPLALKLAGARLKSMLTQEWLDTFQHVKQMRFPLKSASGEGERSRNLEVCFDLSVEQLQESYRLLYYTLGIFPEDVWIPQHVVTRLWQHLNPDVTEFDCKELILNLNRLALLDLTKDHSALSLHDLLHDYTKSHLDNIPELHSKLLASYNSNPNATPWHNLPNTLDHSYLFEYLPYHMSEAGRQAELYEILITAPNWLGTVSETGRNLTIERLLLNIWQRYWTQDETLAHSFLVKWLRAGTPSAHGRHSGYNPKLIAVQCAFLVGDSEALALALQSQDDVVQDTAVKYAFYLDEVDPESSIKALKSASYRVMRFGLPNQRVLRVLFPLTLLLMIEHYRKIGAGADRQSLNQLTAILRDTVRRVAYVSARKGVLRYVGDAFRTSLVSLLKQYVKRLLNHNLEEVKASPDRLRITVNSTEEFARFFESPQEEREVILKVIPYLDRTHGSILEIKDQVFSLFASEVQLSITLVNFIIMCRAIDSVSEVYEIYRYVYDRICAEFPEDQNRIAGTAGSISHALFSSLDRQTVIRDEWLLFLKETVISHIDRSPHGYGITHTSMGRYIYYSPMYYGAIWSKLHPDTEIDLIEAYLKRAESKSDRALLIYMIDSLGERATFPENYQGILKCLIPYLSSKDSEIQDHLIQALAIIRNKKPSTVDRFLKDHADRELFKKVESRSFDEPITELARRFHEFVADFLIYSDPVTVRHMIEATSVVIQTEGIDQALEMVVKELLNGVIGENVFIN